MPAPDAPDAPDAPAASKRSDANRSPAVFFVDHERLQHRANREVGQLIAPEVERMRGSFGRLLGMIPDEGARQTALADGMWITKQSLGERLRALEERGWIEIQHDPDDRRARIVRRTAEGTRIRRITEVAMTDMEAAWAEQVGPERYEVFREVLAELAAGPTETLSRRA